ncbi:Lrp/AsnC family transcriptional regulator [Phaeovulum sp.]|uniref:Lrp/AsnC family transcriptional regulator n=1 Tax=Phaeovulum sp. TaxID=2934796 RepID=UPI0039E56CF9
MRRLPLPADALDATDRRILNMLQDRFPLSPAPFAEAALALDLPDDPLDEADLIDRIGRLRDIGAITRFGPYFDATAMGGAFCLCALEVPEDRFDEVTALINAHPEVAHNYERTHRLNMWFGLAAATVQGIEAVAAAIEKETGLTLHRFPDTYEFPIGHRVQA